MAITGRTASLSWETLGDDDVASAYHEDTLSTNLAEMLARMKGVEPTHEGFHLYEYIDPEALDALLEHAEDRAEVSWTLEFEAGAVAVTVRSDGGTRITRSD